MLVSAATRNLYDIGFFRQKKLSAPAISIGNLTMGGSGKTPFTLYLAERLTALGKKPAIILRGYGRKTTGPMLVTKDKTAEEVGEEALIYRDVSDADVAVSEKREKAAALLPSRPDVYLLDDAFQHFRVFRDRDILLVDASRPGDLRALPFGKLREPLGAAKRASLIAVTKGAVRDLPEKLQKIISDRPVVEVDFQWEDTLRPSGVPQSAYNEKKSFMLLGIGNPHNFRAMALERNFTIVGERFLPDHAFPTERLVQEINELAERSGAEYILTSEKDFVKWSKTAGLRFELVFPRLRLAVSDPGKLIDELLSEL